MRPSTAARSPSRPLTRWVHLGHEIWPGMLVAMLVAMAAAFLGSHYKGSMLLFALLLGMALGFLGDDPRCRPGILFAGSTVLRVGVALLGLRLTVEHVAALGWVAVAALAVSVVCTMAVALLLAKAFGMERSFGIMAGGATAICGASAALAIASVLPQREGLDRDTTFTIIGVTTLSTIAMIAYPVLSAWAGFDAVTAGQFIGATVHDVAQVVGAGYAISTEAGDAATITKLVRVALLLPTLFVVTLMMRSRDPGLIRRTPLLPWFAVAFGLLVLVNSSGWVPASAHAFAGTASQAALVVAIAAVGLKTSLRQVATLGWRPVVLMVVVTLWLAGMVALYLHLRS